MVRWYLLAPVFTAGLALGAHAIYNQEKLDVGHLFKGFQIQQSSQLFIFGAITILVYLLIFVLFIAFIGMDFIGLAMSGGDPDPELITGMMGKMILLIPLGIVAMIIFMLALWFPPLLIGIHGVSAMEALKIGFKGAMKNIGAVIVFILMIFVFTLVLTLIIGILIGILTIVSEAIAIVLGVIIAIPLMLLSVGFMAGISYHAYRDIFLTQD